MSQRHLGTMWSSLVYTTLGIKGDAKRSHDQNVYGFGAIGLCPHAMVTLRKKVQKLSLGGTLSKGLYQRNAFIVPITIGGSTCFLSCSHHRNWE